MNAKNTSIFRRYVLFNGLICIGEKKMKWYW